MTSGKLAAAIQQFEADRTNKSANSMICKILQDETELLVFANNKLVELAGHRPMPECDDDVLMTFIADCQPVYEAITTHAANVATALAAILRDAGWSQEIPVAKKDPDQSSDGESS
jgi:hypothetical protein